MRPLSYAEVLRAVARNVRTIRLARAISQEEAAHRGQIAVRQWQRAEAGEGITLRTLAAVATGLGVDIADLLRR